MKKPDYFPPCRKCCGLNGVHYLTCPTLKLAPGWYKRTLAQEGQP